MSVPVRPPPAPPAVPTTGPTPGPSPGPPPARTRIPWITSVGVGAAVLLAGTPVMAVVQGTSWLGDAAAAVAAVVVVGLLLHRAGPVVVAAGQCVAVLGLLTALFTTNGILGVIPGPAAMGEFGPLVAGAGSQIAAGIAPVPATPEILFLVTGAFGLVAVAVHLAAVSAAAPAAAGVPLLAVFAVPAALADDLLPWWAMASAAAAFGLLLLARDSARRQQIPGGTTLVAGAVVLALGVGAVTGFVGTAGRFDTGAGTGGAAGSIGLSPFTSLRGQLDEATPVELFRVRGLPQATYLRALTLRDYVPDAGWQATRPDPGPPLPGPMTISPAPDIAEVQVENVAFRDYWLPLYGNPIELSGVPTGQWTYDARSGTAYTARPREEDSWQQRTSLAAPTAEQLRDADGPGTPGADYLNVTGVDPRVKALATQVVKGRTTAFDRTLALQDFFTGPGSQFSYDLKTAPGAGDDALVEFLTVGKVGYCEQFASAMAVMLRTVGVPARVAVGFTGGTEKGDYRSISTSDAHAWVEAWFPGIGWTTFDPTPLTDGRTITPPYVAEANAEAAAADGTSADGASPLDDPKARTPASPTDPGAAPPEIPAPAPAADSAVPVWPFVALVALVLVVAALFPAGLRERERRRRLAAVARGGPGAAGAAWAELLAESADRGAPCPPSDTVRSGARRLVREHQLDAGAQQALRQVVAAVEASWYGDGSAGAGQHDALPDALAAVRAGIAASRKLTLRERLLPRSVMRRQAQDHPTASDAATGPAPTGSAGPADDPSDQPERSTAGRS